MCSKGVNYKRCVNCLGSTTGYWWSWSLIDWLQHTPLVSITDITCADLMLFSLPHTAGDRRCHAWPHLTMRFEADRLRSLSVVSFSKNGQPLLSIVKSKRLRLSVCIGHMSALVKCPLGQVVLYNMHGLWNTIHRRLDNLDFTFQCQMPWGELKKVLFIQSKLLLIKTSYGTMFHTNIGPSCTVTEIWAQIDYKGTAE